MGNPLRWTQQSLPMMNMAVVRRLNPWLQRFVNRRLWLRAIGGGLLLWLLGFGWWFGQLPAVQTADLPPALTKAANPAAPPPESTTGESPKGESPKAEFPKPSAPADAIVVLTGGVGRINSGLSLLADGLAPRLFISGVHKTVDTQQMARAKGTVQRAWLNCCVTLGYHARDTIENAAEVANWVQGQQPPIQHLYLVTHRLHMPRALYLLRQRLPDAITITPYPIADPYTLNDWQFWSFAISEYSKNLAVRVVY